MLLIAPSHVACTVLKQTALDSPLLTRAWHPVDLAGRIRATYPGLFLGFPDPIHEWAYGKHE